MKNKSIDDWIALSATQKRKLATKNSELREKDAQIKQLENRLKRQTKKLDRQIENEDFLSEQLSKKKEHLKLLRKQLKNKSSGINEFSIALEKLSAENEALKQVLVEKDKIHARLNQTITKANNRSEATPVEENQHTSPIGRLLEGMENGTVGTNQVQGGAAGALG